MKVLIAEDDPVSRRLLEVFLGKWGHEVTVARDGVEAWELLQNPDAPTLVISDWMMPCIDGLELCRRIRGMAKPDYTYFIILTAKEKKEDVITGLEAGADDYLVKPFDWEELRYRVKIGERIISLEQRILQLASTDSLTGVFNRRAFMERMDQELYRANREGIPLSLIMADIDHFKRINDRYGHQVGDLVLQRFTERLSINSRRYDFVGRYGGEEFVVCSPGMKVSQGESAAERMRIKIEEMRIAVHDNSSPPIQITASFGVAFFQTGQNDTVDSIIGRADKALYQAKREGRNRVCLE